MWWIANIWGVVREKTLGTEYVAMYVADRFPHVLCAILLFFRTRRWNGKGMDEWIWTYIAAGTMNLILSGLNGSVVGGAVTLSWHCCCDWMVCVCGCVKIDRLCDLARKMVMKWRCCFWCCSYQNTLCVGSCFNGRYAGGDAREASTSYWRYIKTGSVRSTVCQRTEYPQVQCTITMPRFVFGVVWSRNMGIVGRFVALFQLRAVGSDMYIYMGVGRLISCMRSLSWSKPIIRILN